MAPVGGTYIDSYGQKPAKNQGTSLPGSAQAAAAANNAVNAPSGNSTGSPNPYDTSSLPFQGVYQEDQASANKAYQDAVAGLQQQRQGYNLQYGFNAQGQEDPNNQLGLFQLQRGAEARDLEDARNASLARGIGGIGLGAQAEEGLHFQQDAADNNLLSTYKGLLNQNDQGRLGAANDLQASLLQARRTQIQNAIDSGYFTPQIVGDQPTKAVTAPYSAHTSPKEVVRKPLSHVTGHLPAPKLKPKSKPKARPS